MWPLLTLVAIIAVYKCKKYNGSQRFLLSVLFVILPVIAALLYLLVHYRSHILFWSNSATKDTMWIAESDISHGSSSD